MVDEAEIFKVADRLRADAVRVTLKAVRAKLRRRGSNRDILPLLQK